MELLNVFIPWFAFICFLFLMAYFFSSEFREYIRILFLFFKKKDDNDYHNDYYGSNPY